MMRSNLPTGSGAHLARWSGLAACLILATTLIVACAGEGSQTADNGGIGGTGISQGTISAFGSIFVNGVEWDLAGAAIEVDGVEGTEADLRVGMKVRIVGDLAMGGLSGSANSVAFDDSTEGPISDVPTLILPAGTQKTFTILGQTIIVDQANTVFDDGASFAGLAMDQVLEVSGFEEGSNTIRATRVSLRGVFPLVSTASLCGIVNNLMKNPDGSGVFEIFSITVRYVPTTEFSDFIRDDLVDGLMVDVAGDLRPAGNELDAAGIELEEGGLGQQEAEDVELEGVVSNFVSLADFRVAGIRVDASAATLEPSSLVVVDGALVEAEGRLVAGVIIADRLESEEEEEGEVAIEAAVTSIDIGARELTILGLIVAADGDTEIQDERDGDESFQFSEIQVGDWLKIEGFEIGAARVRAKQIARDSSGNDVVLRGPVSFLDRMTPAMSILGQAIPLIPTTAYFNLLAQPRTEEQFFRTPGDVNPGDAVVVMDVNAANDDELAEADIVTSD